MPEVCQHAECEEPADFELLDLADPDDGTCVTYACELHVGGLLSHDTALPEDCPDEWRVRFVGEKGRAE